MRPQPQFDLVEIVVYVTQATARRDGDLLPLRLPRGLHVPASAACGPHAPRCRAPPLLRVRALSLGSLSSTKAATR